MRQEPTRVVAGPRLAELAAAVSLATDLSMGQPLEHTLRTCLIAVALGERLRLSQDELSDVFYVALLRFVGCTADAHETAARAGDDIALRAAIARLLGGSPAELAAHLASSLGARRGPLPRARQVVRVLLSSTEHWRAGIRAHCELGDYVAQRFGLGPGVRAGLQSAFEQWDGRGLPRGWAGEQVPRAARLAFLARDVEVLHRLGGVDRAVATVRRRSGAAYDPELATEFVGAASAVLEPAAAVSPWQAVLACEPLPHAELRTGQLDAACEAIADFVDLKSPYTAGHSRGVAALAAAAWPDEAASLRTAGFLHDLGRVAVPNSTWDKADRLSDAEWEQVRLHAYHTERILGRVAAWRPLAELMGMHHERLDGSGYHRNRTRAELPLSARVLAAADAYQAMLQPRPHRAQRSRGEAARELEAMAAAGLLDAECVGRVLVAAGAPTHLPRPAWPAGLTDREVEVLRVICQGGTKKQVAAALRISPSTVDHHLRHVYDKAAVQSRAGLAVFALQQDLLK